MFIVEVIPLTLLPPNVPQVLSYFSNQELIRGAVVEVAVNKRAVKAVVLSSVQIEREKLALKRVDFQIKKIDKVLFDKPQISDYQLKIASWIAKYYHAPLGYTLKTILPPFAFKKKYPVVEIRDISLLGSANTNSDHTTGQAPSKQLLIYKTKRLVNYLEPLVQQVKNGQILIIVPEKTTINYFSDYFSKKYGVSVVSSDLPNKELYDAWTKVRSGETKIIIGTRQALNMHFKKLELIILDDPNHEFYKSDMVPRYNAVKLAHKVAELNKARLILTSVIPNVENYYLYDGQTIIIEPRPKFDTEIVDMVQEVKNANWSPLSKKLNEEIIEYLKNNKKVLIFSPRRGYAGILICGNCGSAVKCPQCEVAMRTHRSIEMILACHHCGISKPMPANCPACGSHGLKTIGPAGTQKIYEEIKYSLLRSDLNKIPVLALDTDIVKNETEEEEIISEVSESSLTRSKPGPSVLIATQMIFSHRFRLNFDLIGVINADALINMPDFRSEENLFYQIEKLVNFLPNRLLIQTYNSENEIIKKAANNNYVGFYEKELKLRETLNYPPFYKLVKLTFRHKNKDKASYAARITTEKLKMAIARLRPDEEADPVQSRARDEVASPHGTAGAATSYGIKIIEAVPAYIEKERNLYAFNIFLKVPRDYENIGQFLKYVGPGWIIDVEPRSLL